jgi:threonine aldolase
LKEATVDLGVDVLSFGGTKNGLMFGEAVIFFRKGLSDEFKYIRKQGMQLASKMRFLSAQFLALLEDGLWMENARAANLAASILTEMVSEIECVEISRPVETNHVFARLPKKMIEELRLECFFYVWDKSRNEVRWVTSFDHNREDIEDFCRKLKKLSVNPVN